MKKLISVLLTLTLILTLFAACGASGAPMKNQVMDALHQNSEVQFLKRENDVKKINISLVLVMVHIMLNIC